MSVSPGSIGEIPTREQLREYAERMAEAERIAHFGVWSWKIGTNEVRWSDGLHRIYGLLPGAFAGTLEAFADLLHPDDRQRVLARVDSAVRDREPFVFEERIIRADGQERVLLSQGRPVLGADGEVSMLVGVCHDVTDRVHARRALGRSERRIRAIIDNTPSMVAVKDLDGRYVMSNAETANVLGIDADELIGHECWEFFPTVADQLIANDKRAIAEMEPVYDEAVLDSDGEPRTYLTVTFALPDDEGRPLEVCTVATDVTERREREEERRERLEWQRRIESALAEGRMLLYAQPIVELKTRARDSCELLVRMREDAAVLLPAAFLPQAEKLGLIRAINVWTVDRALGMNGPGQRMVNLSAVTLCDADARDEILELLQARPHIAPEIVFEITETADAQYLEGACEFAKQLRALGCRMALDDFGTGFGSFTYLHQLPLRYLKIDRSFVSRMADSYEDRRIVRSIIGIARQFDLAVVAEGVEDGPTLELLEQLGVEYAQGFHLGVPVSVDGE